MKILLISAAVLWHSLVPAGQGETYRIVAIDDRHVAVERSASHTDHMGVATIIWYDVDLYQAKSIIQDTCLEFVKLDQITMVKQLLQSEVVNHW